MNEHVFRSVCLFGGGGGMALGTQQAQQRFREHHGTFDLVGGYDLDEHACAVYQYLTGVEEKRLDAKIATPGDLWRLCGGVSPQAVWISAPCKGSSKLLSSAKAATEKYVVMNDLSYRGVLTLLDAFPGDEPAFLIFENVPNITTRAARMLKDLRVLLRSRGYIIHDGFHEARHLGDLAQRRKRWFMVARNQRKVPVFLYKPPHKPGKVCGDVLGPLPLPGDPAGGPMHQLSDTSMINLLRLWAIPAGGDWRDLLPDDGTPRRARFRRHHIEKWTEPSVTIGGSGSNGPCGVADPRAEQVSLDLVPQSGAWFNGAAGVEDWERPTRTVIGGRYNGAANVADPRVEMARPEGTFEHVDRVTPWDEPTGTVTGGASQSNGAPSVADPRVGDLRSVDLLGGPAPGRDALRRWEREGVKPPGQTTWFKGKYGVTGWDSPSRTVIGGAGNGAGGVADPRLDLARARPGFTSTDHVLGWGDPSRTVTGASRPGNGAPSVADPRVDLVKGCTGFGNYAVTAWGEPTRTVICGSGANGASAVADPRLDLGLPPDTFHHVNRVTAWDDATGTVTHAPAPSSGAPAVADPRLHAPRFKGSLGVLAANEPAGTVTSEAAPSTGAFSYAAPLPPALRPQAGNGALHYGKYIVVPWGGPAKTVTTASRVGSGAQAVADPRGVDLSKGPSSFHEGGGPGRYGVLSPLGPSCTVTSNARVNTGPFSYAGPAPAPIDLVPKERCYDAGYGVLSRDQPSRTVAATAAVGCGAYAIADDVPAPVDLALGCAPHAGAYGVTEFNQPSTTITAHHKVDNAPAAVADPRPPQAYVVLSHAETTRIVDGEVTVPFAIVDPSNPQEPLAIVDDLKDPPYRWKVVTTTKVHKRTGKTTIKSTRRKVTVPLVLISADDTWHRPLTTLELAVLQGFPSRHQGAPLDFRCGTTIAREIIGNAVPPPVARAMAEQMLLSLIVAATVGFSLGDPGTPVWVKNVRRLERELRREGYLVVKGRKPMNFTTGELLDDGAVRWRAPHSRPRRSRRDGRRSQHVTPRLVQPSAGHA